MLGASGELSRLGEGVCQGLEQGVTRTRTRPIRFVATEDGGCICDDAFFHDATLELSGDFATPEQKIAYAEAVAKALNEAEIPGA